MNQSALFLSHGSPMTLLDLERKEDFLRLGKSLQKPEYIIIMSAHWHTDNLLISSNAEYDLIYDFYGFPEELYEFQYPAKGFREKAKELIKNLKNNFDVQEDGERGLDHGAWVPLSMMFPEADIPVISISTPKNFSAEDFMKMGEILSSLSGALIIGSGSMTHNLYFLNPDKNSHYDWAEEFDAWAQESIQNRDWEKLLAYEKHPLYKKNHPTDEHFLPLFFAIGAGKNKKQIQFPIMGIEYGSISYQSVLFV